MRRARHFSLCFLFTLALSCAESCQYFDALRSSPVTDSQLQKYVTDNSTFWCITEIQLPCDEDEYRRIDGTCNNLQFPIMGSGKTPFLRFLPPNYAEGYSSRLDHDGLDLPAQRLLRTELLAAGKATGPLTLNAANYLVFAASDTTDNHDTVNYALWKPYCCLPEGKTDPMCYPNEVPEDDPVHRFSGVRCYGMTKPITFQNSGCADNNTMPERIMTSTVHIDLSTIYGNDMMSLKKKGRLFNGGLLKYEVDDWGRIWPPSSKERDTLCYLNEKPKETRCHDTPNIGTNSLFGINIISIWFWRNHNKIALEVARVNPSWDDEQLFYVARDINIATYSQIYYYELLALVFGPENMVNKYVTSSSPLHRDLYDENVLPRLTLEFIAVMRWFHIIQEGTYRLYTSEGEVYDEIPVVNLTLRTGYLDEHIEGLTHGLHRQAGAGIDYIVDPDIAEIGLGGLQRVVDITTNDLAKYRLFGFQPYVTYLEVCRHKTYTTFDDLIDVMDPEQIEIMRRNYKCVGDIDLMAGLWLERIVTGTFVPPTLICLASDQFLRTVVSDRHWYERKGRPHAFTEEQLLEIRKATIARLMCDNADGISQIQPRAFELIGPGNEITSCRNIPAIDYTKWDSTRTSAQ